jgi:hypothetical protein
MKTDTYYLVKMKGVYELHRKVPVLLWNDLYHYHFIEPMRSEIAVFCTSLFRKFAPSIHLKLHYYSKVKVTHLKYGFKFEMVGKPVKMEVTER